mgnify:FL=1
MFQDGTFSLIHCPGCSCSSNNITVPNFVENDGGGGTANVLFLHGRQVVEKIMTHSVELAEVVVIIVVVTL